MDAPFRCVVREIEDQATAWITAENPSEEVKAFFRAFGSHMQARHQLCVLLLAAIKPGLLTAIRNGSCWFRGEVTEVRAGVVTVFLGDCDTKVDREIGQIWILPPRFRIQPWQAIRMGLEGIRPRNNRPIRKIIAFAKHVMENRSGCVVNISTKEDGHIEGRLLLDRLPNQPPHDIAEGWLQLGYAVPIRTSPSK